MLFDLQGKRRRMVQVTYLTLAVLMGGGLVLFGIGGDVQGGIFDAFTGEGGNSSNGNSVIEKRVDSNEKKLKANPQSERLRKSLTRDYYQLATAQADANGKFSDDGKANLRKAAANWQAYLALKPEKPDTSLARAGAPDLRPDRAQPQEPGQRARAADRPEENDAQAYLNLVQYAALAGDTRIADLAGAEGRRPGAGGPAQAGARAGQAAEEPPGRAGRPGRPGRGRVGRDPPAVMPSALWPIMSRQGARGRSRRGAK